MSYDDVYAILRSEIGLAVDSIGTRTVDAAVEERRRECGARNLAAYVERLHLLPAERVALIEAVVVPETWFFRDRAPFVALARVARGWLDEAAKGRALSLLSLACATGEEPYSMVMALLEVGVPLERISVTAVDVSARALERAHKGVYGKSSFRGDELQFRARWFAAHGRGWEIDEKLRRRVRFVRANILAPLPIYEQGRYDAIFCRNLLIYLTADARRTLAGSLPPKLGEHGRLFVGAADPIDVLLPHLANAGEPGVFAHRAEKSRKRGSGTKLKKLPRSEPRLVPIAPVALEKIDVVKQARKLADAGALVEAAALLERNLGAIGADGNAYHLLGEIAQAQGDATRAEALFEKALYCDPRHELALIHLALLCERRGDRAAASNFRRRAQRAARGRS